MDFYLYREIKSFNHYCTLQYLIQILDQLSQFINVDKLKLMAFDQDKIVIIELRNQNVISVIFMQSL
ncbi:hypothetical protein pb186bvf_008987 [Paramecium bursaria]